MEMHFSRPTVIAAIDVLSACFAQATASAFLIELGPDVYRDVRDEKVSTLKRMNDLKVFIDDHPGHVADDGPLETVVVEKAAGFLSGADPMSPGWEWCEPEDLPPAPKRFKRRLEQDGYVIVNGALRRMLPIDVALPEAASEMQQLLERHGLGTAQEHLDQAFDAHARGNWASANAQLRTFFDALLDGIAAHLDPDAANLQSGQPCRAKLAAKGFLSVPLNEWGDDGKGFINGLVRRLHPQGAHPGLSDEEDSTFRLHVVLLTAGLLLRRFDRSTGR